MTAEMSGTAVPPRIVRARADTAAARWIGCCVHLAIFDPDRGGRGGQLHVTAHHEVIAARPALSQRPTAATSSRTSGRASVARPDAGRPRRRCLDTVATGPLDRRPRCGRQAGSGRQIATNECFASRAPPARHVHRQVNARPEEYAADPHGRRVAMAHAAQCRDGSSVDAATYPSMHGKAVFEVRPLKGNAVVVPTLVSLGCAAIASRSRR